MWTRQDIKLRARQSLKGIYWKTLLVSIIFRFATMDGTSSSSQNIMENGVQWLMTIIPLIIAYSILFILVKLFIFYPLEAGCKRYFMRAAQEDAYFGWVNSFFGEAYSSSIKTQLYRDLIIILYSCLLIIPGIIKYYTFHMVSFILADNPEISPRRARELSTEMMKGNRWDTFVLDLSFIGWYLLGLVAFVVGVVFVFPYHHMAKAQLYLHLRAKAIENGFTTYEELDLDVPRDN